MSSVIGPDSQGRWMERVFNEVTCEAVLLLQFQLFCLRLWNPDLFTGCATLSQTCCFLLSLSLPHLMSQTLNAQL